MEQSLEHNAAQVVKYVIQTVLFANLPLNVKFVMWVIFYLPTKLVPLQYVYQIVQSAKVKTHAKIAQINIIYKIQVVCKLVSLA
jgi:hypothetical protein